MLPRNHPIVQLAERLRISVAASTTREPGKFTFNALPMLSNGDNEAQRRVSVAIQQAIPEVRSSAVVGFESRDAFMAHATREEALKAIDIAITILTGE